MGTKTATWPHEGLKPLRPPPLPARPAPARVAAGGERRSLRTAHKRRGQRRAVGAAGSGSGSVSVSGRQQHGAGLAAVGSGGAAAAARPGGTQPRRQLRAADRFLLRAVHRVLGVHGGRLPPGQRRPHGQEHAVRWGTDGVGDPECGGVGFEPSLCVGILCGAGDGGLLYVTADPWVAALVTVMLLLGSWRVLGAVVRSRSRVEHPLEWSGGGEDDGQQLCFRDCTGFGETYMTQCLFGGFPPAPAEAVPADGV